ncbi:MAG: hypothetical protein K2M08_06330 [Anaeroplasmataceae bacterium]|nr:hypothetical protein [Anaeroplasmataceae bacterium]
MNCPFSLKFSITSVRLTFFEGIGHAVASGHMKEHSMVASDYAIKVIDLMYDNDLEKVTEERLWQLEKLKEISLLK